MTPEAVNALVGRDVTFKLGDRALPFTAEGFLMSFSLPNFFFHATTAYDILRHKGAPLGKRDFMGKMKLKGGREQPFATPSPGNRSSRTRVRPAR